MVIVKFWEDREWELYLNYRDEKVVRGVIKNK